MDTILRTVFNHFLQAFCEPLKKEGVEISFVDGLVVKDLILRPDAINHELEKADADMRIEEGRIGLLRLCYTTLPGVVTMQMNGVDIRVRPNALRTLGRVMKKGLNDLLTPDDEEMLPHREHPIIDPRNRAILSPVLTSNYHQPGCPQHSTGSLTAWAADEHGYLFPAPCPSCQQMAEMSSQIPPPTASAPVQFADNEVVYLSPKQMKKILKHSKGISTHGPHVRRGVTRRSDDGTTAAPVPSLRRTISAKVHHHLAGHSSYQHLHHHHHHAALPSSSYEDSSHSYPYPTQDSSSGHNYNGIRTHEPHCPLSRQRHSLRGCHQVCRSAKAPAQMKVVDGVSHSSESVPQARRRNMFPQLSPAPPLGVFASSNQGLQHPPHARQTSQPPPPRAVPQTLKQSPLLPVHTRSHTTWDPPPR